VLDPGRRIYSTKEACMKEHRVWSRGWRGGVLILAGVLMGAILIQPAVAHVTRKVAHLVKHLNPVYVNEGQSAGGDLSGSYPNPNVAANSISTAKIQDSAVTTAKIANDAVTAAKIGADQVGSSEIATNAVGSSEVADNSLTSDDLGSNSVGASEVNLSVGAASSALVDGGGTGQNGNISAASVTVACATGQEIIGVSIDWATSPAAGVEELYILESRRTSSTGWVVWAGNDTGVDNTVFVSPLCLAAP
jgi:hypothetical protein